MDKENDGLLEKEEDGSDPPHKERRLSLKSPKNCRFQYKSKEEMEQYRYVPKNTGKNTRLARKCFTDRLYQRNRVSDKNDKCPESILEVQSPDVLNNWLPKFIAKAHQSDGEPYTPTSIHQILSGLLRYMRSINDDCANFVDKSDACFRAIQRSCEFA